MNLFFTVDNNFSIKTTILFMLFFVCFLTEKSFASEGVFFSAMDMKQISQPSQANPNSFVYRIVSGSSYLYYEINLNDLVYRSKNVFSLKDIDVDFKNLLNVNIYDARAKVGSNSYITEAIFHEEFILLDNHKTIFFEANGAVVSLNAMNTPPGLVLLSGSSSISLFSIGNEGALIEKGNLPATVVAGDVAQFYIAKRRGYIFSELKLWSNPGSIVTKQIDLKEITNVSVVRKRFSIDIDNIESDRDKIAYLDSLSIEVKEEIKGQEQMKDFFINLLSSDIEPMHLKENFENSSEFENREKIYNQEYEATLAAGLRRNDFDVVIEEYNNRLLILENYRNNILSKSQKHDLYDMIDGGIFFNISSILGRNMPSFTFMQAPAGLLGGNAELEYNKNFGSVSGLALIGANYTTWKFNSLYADRSNLKEAKAGVGISVPLVKGDKQLLMVSTNGVFYYSQLNIEGFNVHEAETLAESVTKYSFEESEIAFGAEVGISYYFSGLPASIFLIYGYNSEKFGDLRLGFGLPLKFIPKF